MILDSSSVDSKPYESTNATSSSSFQEERVEHHSLVDSSQELISKLRAELELERRSKLQVPRYLKQACDPVEKQIVFNRKNLAFCKLFGEHAYEKTAKYCFGSPVRASVMSSPYIPGVIVIMLGIFQVVSSGWMIAATCVFTALMVIWALVSYDLVIVYLCLHDSTNFLQLILIIANGIGFGFCLGWDDARSICYAFFCFGSHLILICIDSMPVRHRVFSIPFLYSLAIFDLVFLILVNLGLVPGFEDVDIFVINGVRNDWPLPYSALSMFNSSLVTSIFVTVTDLWVRHRSLREGKGMLRSITVPMHGRDDDPDRVYYKWLDDYF